MQDIKKRVEDWLFWYRGWYEIPNDYNKDIIEGKTTGLQDRAIDAALIIKELAVREEKLIQLAKYMPQACAYAKTLAEQEGRTANGWFWQMKGAEAETTLTMLGITETKD